MLKYHIIDIKNTFYQIWIFSQNMEIKNNMDNGNFIKLFSKKSAFVSNIEIRALVH